MPLLPGTRIAGYDVVEPLGAGGMGEVFRARDRKLDREVAIKVLPAAFAADADRRLRFEREMRAVAALSHPNVVAVYDFGEHEGAPYAVLELLRGRSLHDALAGGPPPLATAIDWARQVARGLAAVHELGIVHRDLKPANLFVTASGLVKILDFGLARRLSGVLSEGLATIAGATEPGLVLGTIGYMSPEQARGLRVDARTDLFALGVVLHEMLAGRAPFARQTHVDTLKAILDEPPPEIPDAQCPAPLAALVRRCLEKDPSERFGSARDLEFALGAVALSGSGAGTTRLSAPHRGAGWKRVTFRRGDVPAARFTPDGGGFVFSASWHGTPAEPYLGRFDSPEARPLGIRSAIVAALSKSGELALLLEARGGFLGHRGTLARAALAGGAPRKLSADVDWCDFASDGRELAVVRNAGSIARIEWPIGRTFAEIPGEVTHVRISPNGEAIAFLEHPLAGESRGELVVRAKDGRELVRSTPFADCGGLAWHPSGREVWASAARSGNMQALHAVPLAGAERLLTSVPGRLVLHDVDANGRALVASVHISSGLIAGGTRTPVDRDLSFMDWTGTPEISRDGTLLAFDESGEAGGERYALWLRDLPDGEAVRLSEGSPLAISPDGGAVLAWSVERDRLRLVPTGVGLERTLENPDSLELGFAGAFLDEKTVVFAARRLGEAERTFRQAVFGGAPDPVTPPGVVATIPHPGGALAGRTQEGWALFDGESTPRPLAPLRPDDELVRFTPDGASAWVFRNGAIPLVLERVDLATGVRTVDRSLAPADVAGLVQLGSVRLSEDGAAHVYRYRRYLADLWLVEGLG